VTEREEQPDADGSLAVLHELPGRVVDGRDVVGVERVAQPEGVSEAAQRQDRGVAVAIEDQESPSGDMEQAYPAEERRQAAALSPVE